MARFKVTAKLDRSHVLAVGNSLAAPYIAETTRLALNRMRVTAPKDTGRMANSLKMTMRVRRTFVAGRITASPKYTTYVELGTRAHVIRPKRKKALRFVSRRGQVVIVKKVNHPGTRPRPFMFRSLVEVGVPRGFKVTRTVTYRGRAVE